MHFFRKYAYYKIIESLENEFFIKLINAILISQVQDVNKIESYISSYKKEIDETYFMYDSNDENKKNYGNYLNSINLEYEEFKNRLRQWQKA